jgi:signal transduction histidine kinase
MSDVVAISLIAIGWAAGCGLLVWLFTAPLRRRSTAGLLTSLVLLGFAASLGAMLGAARAMFLSGHDLRVTVIAAVAGSVVSAAAAGMLGRRLAADHRVLAQAVRTMATGQLPPTDRAAATLELRSIRTELTTTATRLAESREREAAAESARRELIGWISHDLRTPLASLKAMSEALEDGVADSPDRYLKLMRVDIDRLTSMVDDLFELSRLQARQAVARDELVSVADLVSDCVASMENLALRKGIVLESRYDPSAVVHGNSRELDRALSNIVTNAIRHTDTGGVVETEVSSDDTSVWIKVTDGCGGIAEQELPRVFDVGFRGESARSPGGTAGAGAGLGLAIATAIVEAHQGHITAVNHGPGCRFTIELPR